MCGGNTRRGQTFVQALTSVGSLLLTGALPEYLNLVNVGLELCDVEHSVSLSWYAFSMARFAWFVKGLSHFATDGAQSKP